MTGVLGSPQPVLQCGSAGETTKQGWGHDVKGQESVAASQDTVEPLSGGIEAAGNGGRISLLNRSSLMPLCLQSSADGVRT